jgi:glycosyltransferase involved in cell wall biosynthesis
MELKKILIFNTAQANDIIGGSQNAIEDAIIVLLKNKFEVYYISSSYNIFNYKNTISGLNRFYVRRISRNPLTFLIDFITTFKNVKKIKFDFVWVNSAKPWFFFKPFIKTKKLIYTFHGPILEEQMYSNANKIKILLSKYLYQYLMNSVHLIHYNTTYVKTTVEFEFTFLKNKKNIVQEVLVSENIVFEKFRILSKLRVENEKFKILIPRRLVNRTGVVNFLQLLLITDKNLLNKFFFYITGDGPQLNEVVTLISKFDNIKYLGVLPESEFNSIFYNVDAICIPSLAAEGFCLPAKVAYLLSKPVLHTGQGGLNETLYGFSKSYCFEYGKSSTLSSSLIKLLNDRNINSSFNNYEGIKFEQRLNNLLFN